jgi:CheY-like chemotaxis protein
MPTDDQPSVSAPKTVLIVEDNDLTLRFFRDLLELNGYLVLTATSGEPVIELARERKPDLILASGCDDYIAKPFKGEDLLRLIQRHTS